MKKIFLLLSIVGSLTFTGCSKDDDHDTYSQTVDLNDVDLGYDVNTGRYALVYPLNPNIYDSDVVLVYRKVNDDGYIVWQPLPRTLYLSDGNEVDYDFNFDTQSLLIYSDATFDLGTAPEFTDHQTFRVVIVPSGFASTVDVNDYNAVMSAINQSGMKVQQIEN